MSFHEPEVQLPLTTGLRYLNRLKWTSLEAGDLCLHNAFPLISIALSVPEKSSFKQNPQFLMFPYGNVSLAGLSIARIHWPIPLYRRYAGQRQTLSQPLFYHYSQRTHFQEKRWVTIFSVTCRISVINRHAVYILNSELRSPICR